MNNRNSEGIIIASDIMLLLYFEEDEKALNIILSKTLLCYYGVNVGGVICNSFGIAVGHMTNVSGCLTEIITIIIITFFYRHII